MKSAYFADDTEKHEASKPKSATGSTSSALLRRRLLGQALAEWPWIGTGVAAMLVTSMANQALPWFMGRMIDSQKPQRDSYRASSNTSVGWYGTLSFSVTQSLLMVVVSGGLASCVRTIALQTAAARIAARLRLAAVTHLLIDQPLEWFQTTHRPNNNNNNNNNMWNDVNATNPPPNQTTELVGRTPAAIQSILTEDVAKMADTLTSTTANLLRSSSAVVFSTYHMLQLHPVLLGVALSVVPVVGLGAVGLHHAVARATRAQRRAAEHAASLLGERLALVAMVRHAHRAHDEVATYQACQEDSVRATVTKAWYSGAFMGFLFGAGASALVVVVGYGSRAVARGALTGGQLTSFSTYCLWLGLGTSGVVKATAETTSGLVAAARYYELCETTPTTASENESETENENEGLEIEDLSNVQSMQVQNVCFSYSANRQPLVLDNVSIDLPRGQVVALVGKNGQGKSTLAALLAGLYRPQSGGIQVQYRDGAIQEYTTLSKAAQKSLVQVIPQSTALFNMSIIDNVRYCNPTASISQVQAALARANCTDFVSRLADGIDTVVGINGCRLSGGERQRLALARALLADPVVLVMDEPTTSLDDAGLVAIRAAVTQDKQEQPRAWLVITHQPATLEWADTIVVLKDGRIVEQGDFAQLRSNPRSELCRLMPDVYSAV
jgi:ABC-type multidrug transport system fused ATPase/permease subunit